MQPMGGKYPAGSLRYDSIPRPTLFPLAGQREVETATLRYSALWSIDPAAALAASSANYLSFALNGVFDITGGGGQQPTGYAKLIARYTYATVLAAKATFQWMPATSSSGICSMVALFITDLDTEVNTLTSMDQLLDLKGRVTPWKTLGALSPVDSKGTAFSASVDIGKRYHVNPLDNVETFGSTIGNNPSELTWLTVAVANPDAAATSNPAAVNFLLTIDYKVVLTGPKAINSTINTPAPLAAPYTSGPWTYSIDSKHGPRRTHRTGEVELLTIGEFNGYAMKLGFPYCPPRDEGLNSDKTPRGWILP